jgi:uncharacterized protein YdhG (YjbR/CyaY superfamily)
MTALEYINALPEERKEAVRKLRQVILDNLPEGFQESFSYGMPGWDVPHSIYPKGYHCNPKEPLPFMGYASQKNSVNFYHMGIYAKPELLNWFVEEYPKHVKGKLDMGKSCVRFKKMDQIPYELIGELVRKMSVQEWIDIYEAQLRK